MYVIDAFLGTAVPIVLTLKTEEPHYGCFCLKIHTIRWYNYGTLVAHYNEWDVLFQLDYGDRLHSCAANCLECASHSRDTQRLDLAVF